MNNATLYEHDFQAWIERHITLLKEARFAELDIDNLVEELEDMGRSNKRELTSRCIILIAHLLKWQYQAGQRSTSWRSSIIEQRAGIAYLLEKVPSLKSAVNNAIQEAHPKAVDIAVAETGFPLRHFPTHCPYSKDDLLNANFYPES